MGRYGFVSPGAMSANAIEKFLVDREMAEQKRQQDALQQQKDEETQRRLNESLELQKQQEARVAEMQRQQQKSSDEDRLFDRNRITQQDDIAATGRRAAQNVAGVRQMAMEGVTSGAATPEAAQRMLYGETGEQIPPGILDPGREMREYEEKKKIDKQYSQPPQGPAANYLTLASPDGTRQQRVPDGPQANALLEQGWTLHDPVAARQQDTPDNAGADYATQTADRVITSIDAIMPRINNWTAGIGGSILSAIPGTEATNVNAELVGVAGNIAFNALQQMRNASKTGGALGQVAIQELEMLKAIEGSMRQNQSPANLKAQLMKIRESMERFKVAQVMGGGLSPGRTGGSGTPNRIGRFEIVP